MQQNTVDTSIVSSYRKGNENLPWLTERTLGGHAFIVMLSIVPVYWAEQNKLALEKKQPTGGKVA